MSTTSIASISALLAAILLHWASLSNATTYHVFTDGSDTAIGTQAQPWKTIEHAVSSVNPGDSVHVHEGTYFPTSTITLNDNNLSLIAGGNAVIIDGSNLPANAHVIDIQGVDSVLIRGFEIRNGPARGINLQASNGTTISSCAIHDHRYGLGLFVWSCTNCLIKGNEFYANGTQGGQANGVTHNVYIAYGCSDVTFEDNYSHDAGAANLHIHGNAGINRRITVRRNIFRNSPYGTLDFMNTHDSTFENNVIINDELRLLSDPSQPPQNAVNNVIVNNTFVNSYTSRTVWLFGPSQSACCGNDNYVFNNIVITANGSSAIQDDGIDNQIGYNFTATYSQNLLNGLFENDANNNYQIKAGTVAHNGGTDAFQGKPAPMGDVTGRLRPQGSAFDIGAYERVGESPLGPSSTVMIDPIATEETTGEKPQSKVWTHDGAWWCVLPRSSGTWLMKLQDTQWNDVINLSPFTDIQADVKPIGSVAHILLFRGNTSQLISVEYVSASETYAVWTLRPTASSVTLDTGVETATIDIDSQGRMWLASDAATTMNVRYSDSPYNSWSDPITIATGVGTDDISVVTAMPGNKIGILWSNKVTRRFGFRVHLDGDDPNTWSADEVPASQSADDLVGEGMANDHLNVAVASDGALYAAIKTNYDAPGYPVMGLLVRRPSGTWDNIYNVSESLDAARPIVLLNEASGVLTFVFKDGIPGINQHIAYAQSSTTPIAFGVPATLQNAELNDPTSTKQNVSDEVVILASSINATSGTRWSFANNPPILAAALPDTTVSAGAGPVDDYRNLNGVFGDVEDGHALNFSVECNSNPQVVTATIDLDSTLDLSFAPNLSGSATISIRATDSGSLFVTDEFVVMATAPNSPPVVVSAIPDTVVVEDSNSINDYRELDLVFNDPQEGHALTFALQSNSNAALVTATLDSGHDLDLSFTADGVGTATIIVRATDSWGLAVRDTFLVTVAGPVTAVGDPELPTRFALYRNAPNPFNPTTVIRYDVPAGGGTVTLRVYEVTGRLIRTLVDGFQRPGQRTVTWDGTDERGDPLASGVYFYRLQAPGLERSLKMVLLR